MTITEFCFVIFAICSVCTLVLQFRKPATGVPAETVTQLLSVLRDSQRLTAVKQQATLDPMVGRMLAGGYAQAMPESVPPVWHGSQVAQDVGSPQDQMDLAAMREDPTHDIHGNPIKYENVGEV